LNATYSELRLGEIELPLRASFFCDYDRIHIPRGHSKRAEPRRQETADSRPVG